MNNSLCSLLKGARTGGNTSPRPMTVVAARGALRHARTTFIRLMRLSPLHFVRSDTPLSPSDAVGSRHTTRSLRHCAAYAAYATRASLRSYAPRILAYARKIHSKIVNYILNQQKKNIQKQRNNILKIQNI